MTRLCRSGRPRILVADIRHPQVLAVNFTSTLSSSLVNEARFGLSRTGANTVGSPERDDIGEEVRSKLLQVNGGPVLTKIVLPDDGFRIRRRRRNPLRQPRGQSQMGLRGYAQLVARPAFFQVRRGIPAVQHEIHSPGKRSGRTQSTSRQHRQRSSGPCHRYRQNGFGGHDHQWKPAGCRKPADISYPARSVGFLRPVSSIR